MSLLRTLSALVLLLMAGGDLPGAEIRPPGFRPVPVGVHALVNGNVVVRPGKVLSSGTILIRDGIIESVGTDLPVPRDARVWDMKGLTIYAGFIDPWLSFSSTGSPEPAASKQDDLTSGGARFYGVPGGERDPGTPGPGSDILGIAPERRVIRGYAPEPKTLEKLRKLGFTAANIVPEKGILRGSSAFVSLSDDNPNETVIRADVFQHIAFEGEPGGERYPRSLMGVIASVRQTFFDAQHYALDFQNYATNTRPRKRPAFNPGLDALQPALRKQMIVAFEPKSALMVERAAQLAKELDLTYCVLSSGQEWRRPDLAEATGANFIVPLNFAEAPKMPEQDDWEDVSLDQLRAWDWAPENPALLRQHGLDVALTTYGLEDKAAFRKNLLLARDRGLSEEDALAALTTVPAKLCGVEKQLGSVEAGKIANLTIVVGNYFDADSKVKGVWIDGRHYRADVEPTKADKADKEEQKTRSPGVPDRAADASPKKQQDQSATASPSQQEPERVISEEVKGTEKPEPEKGNVIVTRPKDDTKSAERELLKTRVAKSPLEGRGPIASPPAILVKNATVWTCGPAGLLENANVLVVSKKIKSVSTTIPTSVPEGAVEIDAQGKHVTPGLIDDHSHAAILDQVNEGTIPSSAMVRIGDVVNSESENIRLQLAGGVTTINLLHGSANPIGGQACVIKLRDGAAPEELKFKDAPAGLKFALGENVKQSNWGDKHSTRFPQSRMGVQTFIANRFIAAQDYMKRWDDYRRATRSSQVESSPKTKTEQGSAPAFGLVPPRRDLELEAIAAVLRGESWIHCHAYRADETLMMVRLAESFGIRVGSFAHTLEGYKIADELAAARVGGTTFSDWWAYKFEVYDAIPYNGSLMRERGALASFSSDSPDLARRLNFEAAKAVKYGGMPEQEALKLVTLNSAKQLRIDSRVGSLEPGKDADFVIWSKSPLEFSTVCQEVWIDGRQYFDKAVASMHAIALEVERKALVEKARKAAKPETSSKNPNSAAVKKFFERALESIQEEDQE